MKTKYRIQIMANTEEWLEDYYASNWHGILEYVLGTHLFLGEFFCIEEVVQ